jgi:hypothetical protein
MEKEGKPVMAKPVDKSTAITIAAAVCIVAAAALTAGLYRFTGLFRPVLTEKRIARNLDFADPRWPEQLVEISIPSFQKDFAVYSAFF